MLRQWVHVCVGLGVALLAAISSSPLPVCSPASHHFISLQYIYPGSSFTHHQIVVSAQVIAYTSGLSLIFSDFSKFGLVTNCFFSIQCPWTITRLPACLPACQLSSSPAHYHLLPPACPCHSPSLLSALQSSASACFIPTPSTSTSPTSLAIKPYFIHCHSSL